MPRTAYTGRHRTPRKPLTRRRRIQISAAVIIVSLLAITGCASAASAAAPANTDPTNGWVTVADTVGMSGRAAQPYYTRVHKVCDGTTLLYVSTGDRSGGMTAIPNSVECR